jgi:hypothetical protein
MVSKKGYINLNTDNRDHRIVINKLREVSSPNYKHLICRDYALAKN